MSKTVYLRLWTPDKKYLCLVHNLPEPEPLPNGAFKDEGWGLVGGGQKPQDLKNYEREVQEMTGTMIVPEIHRHEMATSIRELMEETGLIASQITINPKSRKSDPRSATHEVVAYDALYYTNDTSAKLRPNDPKKLIVEARWIDCMDLMHGEINGLKIYRSHLKLIND